MTWPKTLIYLCFSWFPEKQNLPVDYLDYIAVFVWDGLIFSSSIHPYIFFNPDHATLTFLGFRVDLDGNLLDPQTEEIVKENLMSRHLRTGLHVQKVDLNNDFESYAKYVFSDWRSLLLLSGSKNIGSLCPDIAYLQQQRKHKRQGKGLSVFINSTLASLLRYLL